jgi:hypothetical protein
MREILALPNGQAFPAFPVVPAKHYQTKGGREEIAQVRDESLARLY